MNAASCRRLPDVAYSCAGGCECCCVFCVATSPSNIGCCCIAMPRHKRVHRPKKRNNKFQIQDWTQGCLVCKHVHIPPRHRTALHTSCTYLDDTKRLCDQTLKHHGSTTHTLAKCSLGRSIPSVHPPKVPAGNKDPFTLRSSSSFHFLSVPHVLTPGESLDRG